MNMTIKRVRTFALYVRI